MKSPSFNRRQFISTAAATAAYGMLGAPSTALGAHHDSGLPWKFCTFTKSLQHLNYDQLAARMAPLGFDGIEVPIRPRGHIEPSVVVDELPKMVNALKKKGLEITVLTSGINEVSKRQHTEAVLKTAASLGVKRFRMGYYSYDLDQPIRPQLEEFRARLVDLVAVAKEIGIKPIYQNHSGARNVGAPIWDLHHLIEEIDPAEMGVAFDIAHATIEGGLAWPVNWALIRPWVDTVYVKEHRWGNERRPAWVPVGTGNVDRRFYEELKKSDFKGPISLHVEYHDHRDTSLEGVFLESVAADFATLKGYLKDA